MNKDGIIKDSEMNPAKLQSATIDLLKFPLTIMVLFIHMNPFVINLLEADFSLISGHGIYNVTGILLSHVLTHIAVPTFFFISGFLFFVNFQEWSWEGYKKKMKSRVKTLLRPYLIWNVFSFLLELSIVVIKGDSIEEVQTLITENGWHIFYDYHEWGTTHVNWLGDNLRMTGPFLYPLWFLRDLIVVTILTPIIYYAIKNFGLFIIGVLFIAYISRIWTLLPGFHITAFFYFTTGAYFALNKINIIHFSKKYKIFIPVFLILLVVTTIFDGTNTVVGQNVYPLFVCTGVFTVFLVASACIEHYNIKPNHILVSSCFYIYAIHAIGFPIIGGSPLWFTRSILHKVIPGNTGFEEGFCYLASPFVTAFLCILLLMFARRLFPKTTLYFTGNR